MAIRFFRKFSPETPVVLGNSSSVKFTTLDHLTGYFATDSVYLQQEFERFMRESRYGISEIPADEFHRDYIQKKTTSGPLRPVSREEIGAGSRIQGHNPVASLGAAAVAAAVGVDTSCKPCGVAMESGGSPHSVPGAPPVPLAATPAKPFEPPTGKRSRRPRSS